MKVHRRVWLCIFVLVLVVLGVTALPPGWVRAAGPWYVASGGSNLNTCRGPTSPCATIKGAYAKASDGDTIYVAIGTYTDFGDEVVFLGKRITLSGGWDASFTTQTGASTVDGEDARRGIRVTASAATIERFTIANGSAYKGGGVYNTGILTLKDSTVSDNRVDYQGGGIYNEGSLDLNRSSVGGNNASKGGGIYNDARAIATLVNSIVSGNTADSGGGIYNFTWWNYVSKVQLINSNVSGNRSIGDGGGIYNHSIVSLKNSTVSGNHAGGNGGGLHGGTLILTNSTVSGNTSTDRGGGIYSPGTAILNNSTVSGNTADEYGGGIYNPSGGVVTLRNAILAGNTSETGPDCRGDISSADYNLLGDTSGCTFTPGTGDLSEVDAKLGLLLGPPNAAWYHPLLSGSPAIDAGNPAGCADHASNPLDTDQRGVARPQGSACDMGAYEYTTPGPAASVSAFAGTPQRTPPLTAFPRPLKALVLDSIGTPVSTTLATFSAPDSGASGTFAGSGSYTTTALTEESGVATAATFTANGLDGGYTVTAAVTGVVTPAHFLLSNMGWYVSPSGNDGNDCQTPATACATINGPLRKPGFVAGDAVLVGWGTYTGSGDQVVLLDKSVRLSGGWNTTFTAQSSTSTIDGQAARRGMRVSEGVTAIVERFTVQNGSVGGFDGGGGVYNHGTLTLMNSRIRHNRAPLGGGIMNWGILTLTNSSVSSNLYGDPCCSSTDGGGGIKNTGMLTVNNSAIHGNRLVGGGFPGGGVDNEGTAVLSNSTVSGNAAADDGGGIYNRGTLILNNGTVSGNTGRPGGGIHNSDGYGGAVTLRNSILAGNSTGTFGPDCSGTIASSGYNLIGDTADCTFSASTGDLVNIDARLFRLVGVPGVHPLLPGSPAIDAGNPAGCTDHEGNPLTTDQRGSPRPLDGDGDGDAICDVGAYEVDPDHPVSQVFLPTCIRNFCPDFFDDFSNSASGWAVADDAYVRSEYLDGEYRVLSKQAGYFYLFSAPTCDRRSYVVEADARWVGSPGSGYGLMFGLTGDFEEFYLFDINTDYRRFRLLRADPSDLTVVVPITDAPAINGGTASNHLKVTRDGDQITLEINGTVLGTWTEGSITGYTGSGVVSSPYSSEPVSDARFDNYRVTLIPSGLTAGVPTPGQVGSGAPKPQRRAVPAGMEYR